MLTKIVLSLALFALPSLAGEFVLLKSGARLRADRHHVDGQSVRLFTTGGEIALEASQVAGYEVDDYVPPPAPEPAPAIAAAPAPVAKAPLTPHELVDAAALKYGLPSAIVRSVVKAESGFQPHVVSPKGAIGLMQLMPGTAASLGADPKDPAQNVDAGTRYLRDLLVKYQEDPYQLRRALAAYNAGPGAVDKYNGVPPYAETQNYVRKVILDYQKQSGGSK